MWNRAGLKHNAKMTLKRNYWWAFLVCLIVTFLSGGGASVTFRRTGGIHGGIFGMNVHFPTPMMAFMAVFAFFLALVALVVGVLYAIFILWPMTVGKKRYFMRSRDYQISLDEILFSFRCKKLANVAKTMFFTNLYIFLWTLLFIIPGIIKSYEYFLVPYLLSENPEIETNRALQLSSQMMEGEKWNTFVLQLSFLGWYILGLIPCGLGTYFVTPYYEATVAELYGCLREKSIAAGSTNTYELGGFDEMV